MLPQTVALCGIMRVLDLYLRLCFCVCLRLVYRLQLTSCLLFLALFSNAPLLFCSIYLFVSSHSYWNIGIRAAFMELRRIQVPIWGYVVLICGANWLTTGATGANSSSQPDQPKLDVELSTSIVESAPAPATIIGHPPSKSQLLEELPVVGQETIPFSTKGAIQVLVPVPDSRGQHESQQSVEDRQPRHQQYAPDQYKKQQPPRQLLLPARGKIFDYNHQMATLDLNKDSSLAKAHSLKDNQPRSSLDAIGRASIGPESKMLATKMRHHNVKVCRRRSLFEVLRGK